MKGAILYKGEEFYTDLNRIFTSINNKQNEYNWLITDCTCYPENPEYDLRMNQKYYWIKGEDLTAMIKNENFQIIWGVFSGFKKDVEFEDVIKFNLPYAEEYNGFWQKELSIQHPLAELEIVAWDSSITIFISKRESLVRDFRYKFSKSEDLKLYNKLCSV